ncbi:MAG TPA: MauE/DoxX family redox-associated membrane protein [bacterium]|nr:MauE/DoxX family redox-associated membrane protein [bacterium]
MNCLRNPMLALCARFLVGGVILYAGLSKIGDPSAMAGVIENYRLLPTNLVNPAAVILPGIEIVAGFCLLEGFLIRGSRLIATALILLFLGAILWAIAQGLDIECGCFGTSDAERVGWAVFARDFLLLLLVVPVWFTHKHLFALDEWLAKQRK